MEGLGAHISMGALKKVTKDQLYYGVDPDYLLWTVSKEEGTGEILSCLPNWGGGVLLKYFLNCLESQD